jgi:predicted RNA binding protein YcfA (HicA-like mRNA interferase family)
MTHSHHIPTGSVSELLRAVEARGWTATRTRRHIRLAHPNGGLVHVSSSPSDRRSLANTAALVRRFERSAA